MASISRGPRRPGPILTKLEREPAADGRSGPDALIIGRPGPESFLKPERIDVDTTVVAVAHDGEWIYPTDAIDRAA